MDPYDDLLIIPGSGDSHFHAEVCLEKGIDIVPLLDHACEQGLGFALDISVSPETFETRRRLVERTPSVYMAVGAHPSETGRVHLDSLFDTLTQQARDDRVVALGEIGLDWHWDFGTRAGQRELFRHQLEIADHLNLPVVIHNRDATADIAEILTAHPPRRGGIMHCFSAGADYARTFVDLGMHIGFGGNVTYKKSEDIREAARTVPGDRILVETDAPFLAPQAVRGRPNHPGYLGHTLSFLAELCGVEPRVLAHRSTESFKALCGIHL
jgi:TatD DNase family protein